MGTKKDCRALCTTVLFYLITAFQTPEKMCIRDRPGAYPRHPGADVTGGGHSQHCGCAAAHLHHLVMGDAQILGAGGADGGGAAAVSYTHLDVYKRQVHRRPEQCCGQRPEQLNLTFRAGAICGIGFFQ